MWNRVKDFEENPLIFVMQNFFLGQSLFLPPPSHPSPPPTAPLLARIFTDACNCISMQKINSIYQLILQTKQILQSHDLIVTSKVTSSFSEFLSAFKKSNQFILSIQS